MKKILLVFMSLFCLSFISVNATSLEETLNSNNNSSDTWESLVYGANRPNIVPVGSYQDNTFEYKLGSFTKKYYPAVLLLFIVGWLSWAFKYGKME